VINVTQQYFSYRYGYILVVNLMMENWSTWRKPRLTQCIMVDDCWPRVGEANPLFSVCITLWRWTATATLSMPLNDRGISVPNRVDTHLVDSPHLIAIIYNNRWSPDFIFYQKPLYKSLHQSFFYSFITILPSESGATLHYSTILS
jgi:hypothetical protein